MSASRLGAPEAAGADDGCLVPAEWRSSCRVPAFAVRRYVDVTVRPGFLPLPQPIAG